MNNTNKEEDNMLRVRVIANSNSKYDQEIKTKVSNNLKTKLYNLLKEEEYQGLKYNIQKFKEKAPEAVADLEKIAKETDKYRKCLTGKFLLQTIIPVALMGWIIPKSWCCFFNLSRWI